MSAELPDIYVQFHKLKGECRDEQHPGGEGWIPIHGFHFGLGIKDKGSVTGSPKPVRKPGEPAEAYQKRLDQWLDDREKAEKRETGSETDHGPYDLDEVRLVKNVDLMSTELFRDKCHLGGTVEKVVLQACRAAGIEAKDQPIKNAFLTITFEDVRIKSMDLDLFHEPMPQETLEFLPNRVTIRTVYTDNETGQAWNPMTFAWDFKLQKQIEGKDAG